MGGEWMEGCMAGQYGWVDESGMTDGGMKGCIDSGTDG